MHLVEILLTSGVTAIITLTPVIVQRINAYRERVQTRARRRLYGVVGVYPRQLKDKHYVEFTDYRKFDQSGFSRGVLICKNLSYALRCCDFVFAREGLDPKIVDYDDEDQIKAILDGE